MSSRDAVLGKVRAALRNTNRSDSLPDPLLTIPKMDGETKLELLARNLTALAGQLVQVQRQQVPEAIRDLLGGRRAIVSNASFLRECGISGDMTDVRQAEVGITSADYVLADTGTIVLFASPQEARLISLLPPVHIAVFPASRILSGLDELLVLVPKPTENSSAMVLITGPSRTADIEQILVRGVHGPGELYGVVVHD